MTDGANGWASPSGGRPEQPPQYGERIPGWTPPAPGPATPPPPSPTAYRPPPKRGLIPLHPLSFGQLLGASFGVIRWNPKAAVVPALAIGLVQTALLFGGIGAFAFFAVDRVQRAATEADRQQILAGTIGGGVVFALVTIVVTVFTSALLQGMLVTVIARAAVGERIGIGASLRAGLRRMPALVGVAVLLGLLWLVAVALLGLVVFAIAQAGDSGVVASVLTGIVGVLGLIVLYVFLTIKLTTVPSAIVLEGLGVFAAVKRSWLLMRGAFWRTLGLLAVVVAMVSVASQLVSLPFSVLGGAIGGLLAPNAGGDVQGSVLPVLVSSVPAAIVGVVVGALGQVAQVAAVVLVYLDRRMRREGLDLQLQRFVEEGGADPFERVG